MTFVNTRTASSCLLLLPRCHGGGPLREIRDAVDAALDPGHEIFGRLLRRGHRGEDAIHRLLSLSTAVDTVLVVRLGKSRGKVYSGVLSFGIKRLGRRGLLGAGERR